MLYSSYEDELNDADYYDEDFYSNLEDEEDCYDDYYDE